MVVIVLLRIFVHCNSDCDNEWEIDLAPFNYEEISSTITPDLEDCDVDETSSSDLSMCDKRNRSPLSIWLGWELLRVEFKGISCTASMGINKSGLNFRSCASFLIHIASGGSDIAYLCCSHHLKWGENDGSAATRLLLLLSAIDSTWSRGTSQCLRISPLLSFELNFNLLTFWTCLRLWRNRVRWIRIRLLVSPQCCMMRKAHKSLQDWPETAVGRYLCLDSRFDVHITDLYLVMVRWKPFWMKGIVSIGVKISVSSMWQGIVTYLDRKYSQHRDFDFPQSGRKASGVKQPIFPLNGSTAGFEICVQATVPWYPTPVWYILSLSLSLSEIVWARACSRSFFLILFFQWEFNGTVVFYTATV